MRSSLLIGIWSAVAASTACAAGFVHNENFVVITESGLSSQATEAFARSVLAKAEEYRKQISLEWFGEELPPGIGRATINVRYSAERDSGLTWAVDHPDRKLHTVYLYTRSDQAVGSTLAHEMAHVVLATHFPHPHRLPAWVEEGIASRYDHAERRQTRADVLKFFARQEHWPGIGTVLEAQNIAADDTQSYAVAVSLTEMLLAARDKAAFLEFGRTASREGTRRALQRHYQIADVAQLQAQWQDWVVRSATSTQLSQRAGARTFQGQ